MAFDRLEPIGGRRLDYLAALLAYVISENARGLAGAKEKSGKTVADYVPNWWTDEEKEEVVQQDSLSTKVKAAFGIGLGGKANGR